MHRTDETIQKRVCNPPSPPPPPISPSPIPTVLFMIYTKSRNDHDNKANTPPPPPPPPPPPLPPCFQSTRTTNCKESSAFGIHSACSWGLNVTTWAPAGTLKPPITIGIILMAISDESARSLFCFLHRKKLAEAKSNQGAISSWNCSQLVWVFNKTHSQKKVNACFLLSTKITDVNGYGFYWNIIYVTLTNVNITQKRTRFVLLLQKKRKKEKKSQRREEASVCNITLTYSNGIMTTAILRAQCLS